MKRLRVLMTRQEIVPERLAGATAVVIDVFMATTTLLTILENGARDVYPVADLEEAEAEGQTFCGYTQDHKEGVTAFFEKRAARFTGLL